MKSVDVDHMLDHCRKLLAANQHAYVDPDTCAMAQFIVDVFGVAFPCGFPEPRVGNAPDSSKNVMREDLALGTRDEALGIAAAIVRCALELPEET